MRLDPSRTKRGEQDEDGSSHGYYAIRARGRDDAGIRRRAGYGVRRAYQARSGTALAARAPLLDDAGLRDRAARWREVPLRLAQRRRPGNGDGGDVQGDGAPRAP